VLSDSCAKPLFDVEWIFSVQGGIVLVGGSVEDIVVELMESANAMKDKILLIHRMAVRINQYQHMRLVA
jgi:hypothetical protein